MRDCRAFVRQVARISQMIALVFGSVLVRPHRRPPESDRLPASQPIHETQQVSRQTLSSTVSRRSSVGWSLWHRWSSWEGLATRAAQEGSSQRDRELSSDCRDRVFDMPFGSDRRRRGVWDGWIYEMFGAAGGLRGESPLVRG